MKEEDPLIYEKIRNSIPDHKLNRSLDLIPVQGVESGPKAKNNQNDEEFMNKKRNFKKGMISPTGIFSENSPY